MSSQKHVICVLFPGAGHAVNMFNVANVLGTPSKTVHVLVMSGAKGRQWMEATGQTPNPNVLLEVLAEGKWETWKESEPRELVAQVNSDEFTQAVDDKITELKQQVDNGVTGMIFNALMGKVGRVGKRHGLKLHLLMPVAYYQYRYASAVEDEASCQTRLIFKGIGGSDRDMQGELGDAVDMLGPFAKMARPTFDISDGMILSNTNVGLEGDAYKQPDMYKSQHFHEPTEYMIGPILPEWFESAFKDPDLRDERLRAASEDPCIQFMNQQPAKSVVYVALGSHVELSVDQAKVIVDNLRKHGVPWVLLFREGTEEMRQLLGDGGISDGVVTAWAPQLEILQHPALKCVVSHGGFGTMIEGVYAGAAFITSPAASDQFTDTRVMRHLGMCVGCIAENRYTSIMQRSKLTPFWPDDGGKSLEQLFGRIFGTKEGEEELEKARAASRALRDRMVEAKAKDSAKQLEQLRKDITAT